MENIADYKYALDESAILTIFCNIVSHNLRGPLINISMLIGFLEKYETTKVESGILLRIADNGLGIDLEKHSRHLFY